MTAPNNPTPEKTMTDKQGDGEVQRFDLDFHGQHGEDAYMAKDDDGDYVLYDDHVAALAADRDSVLENDLRSLLSGEYTSLTIGFNDDHAFNYADAQRWHDEYGGYQGGDDDRIEWVSEDERKKAVEQNSVWTIQWYPNTPVGFNCIGASSLTALVAAIRSMKVKP